MNITTEERFMNKVSPEPNSGCWLWTAQVDKDGYGVFRTVPTSTQAHRMSYKIFVGDIPDGMFVLHRCDMPGCVNPDHLWVGTHKDNMKDMKDKGRRWVTYGERNKMAKLTDHDVFAIIKDNRTGRDIAHSHQVSETTISRIINGGTWSHITGIGVK